MKLSEMCEVLAARGMQLTKSLGQNFLHDGNQLRRIVEAAELTKRDKVLEIGPGLGPLTELLLASAGEVLAVEKDAQLVEFLRERFKVGQASRLPSERVNASRSLASPTGSGETPALLLLHDDVLEFLRREPRDWRDWKLVANLPYSVASPILVELAQTGKRPERMVVTLQLEVARRLMAGPGEKDYGVLSLLVQLNYEARNSFKIPASCFFPAPDVDSACVTLVHRTKPLLVEEHRGTFARIVKRAFSQRRKKMLKVLKEDWPEQRLADAFGVMRLSDQVRAETLSLEQFTKLTSLLVS